MSPVPGKHPPRPERAGLAAIRATTLRRRFSAFGETAPAALSALAAYVFWGLAPIYFKWIQAAPPLEIIAHRILWSIPLLAGFLLLRDGRRFWSRMRLPLRSIGVLLLSGTLVALNWLIFVWAVVNGQVLATSLGYFIGPLVNFLLGFLFLHERMTRVQRLGVLIAAAGTVYLGWYLGTAPWVSLGLAFSFGVYGLVRKLLDVGPMVGLLWETLLLSLPAFAFLALLAGRGQIYFGSTPGLSQDLLLILAGALWLLAALIYAQVPEQPGETGGGRNAAEALRQLRLLATDRPFLRFVITRALLMCSALSAPYYVALAQREIGSPAWLLGAFVAAAGVASLVSAPLWGRFADRSSRSVMVAAALITSGIGLLTTLADAFAPPLIATAWFLPLAYFVLSAAHSGVRVGRKTYVVNLAGGNKRTDYVAISNTVIGVLLLLVGSVGALSPLIGDAGVIALLALMGLAGALLGTSLPETQDD